MKITSRLTTTRDELVSRIKQAQAAFAAGKAADPDLLALAGRLAAGSQRLSDMSLYSTRDASSTTAVKFFQPQDSRDRGITNVANAQLDKNGLFLAGSITLLAGTASGAINNSRDTLGRLNYGSVAGISGLVTGELTFRYHGKDVIYKMPVSRFCTENDERAQLGELVLDSPIMLREQDPFEVNIELGTSLPAKTGLRLLLNGVGTISN